MEDRFYCHHQTPTLLPPGVPQTPPPPPVPPVPPPGPSPLAPTAKAKVTPKGPKTPTSPRCGKPPSFHKKVFGCSKHTQDCFFEFIWSTDFFVEVLVSKKKGRVSHYNKFYGFFFKVLVSKIITEEFFNVFHALTTKRKKQLELW